MTPLADLMTPLTVEQLKGTAFAVLQALGFKPTAWASGASIRVVVILICRLIAPFTDAMVAVTAAGFLDYATGLFLTVLAQQVYNVDRRLATFAAGFVTLTNAAGGDYTWAAGELRVLNESTGKIYRNTGTIVLAPFATVDDAPIEALEAGSGSTSAPGTISAFDTQYLGVTVTNDAAVVGDDAELDPDLRIRCRAKLGALSPNGPKEAYDFILRTPSLNGGVTVTRTKIVPESASGDVTCYVAGPSGEISGPDVALLQTAVETQAEPWTIDSEVLSADAVTVAVTSTVYLYASANMLSADVQALVAAHLTGWLPTVPIGGNEGFLYRTAIEGEIKAAGRIGAAVGPLYRVAVTLPAGDTVLAPNQVAVLGTVTTTVVQV